MNNNLKKVISSVAAFAVVASTATAFAAFPDVDESASYAGAVDTLTALGIVEGDDNGKFNPDNSVTRAEFAKMVVEARGEGAAAASQTVSQFTDSQNHWAVGYIAQGVSDGFINGYDDTTFGPDDTVTYAQAVKMLVCAIGYDSRAQLIGGWPTGYLSYGGTLGIINGVSGVSSDTALTRAQCAVLINNTLRAPLVVFGDVNYGGLTGTVPQQSTVVKDGVGKDWQTLLTNNHDAYAVRGRVTATSKTGNGLDADQVQFKVESAENFDGNEVGTKVEYTPTVDAYIGSTKAADMLFTYSDAIIQKDKDTDEYTLISITPYGANKTERFPAADLSSDDSVVTGDNKKLSVYKSSTSTSVTNYKLNKEAKLYVNGVELTDGITEENVASYLYNNKVGTVTIIDETETGSTSTDGYYDYVLVDYYKDAVADYVSEGSNGMTTVYFNDYDQEGGLKSKLTWDTEDEDISVKFVKDDAEISVADIQQNDVLSIAYDVTGDFNNSSFYDVLVSQDTVTGQATSQYTDDGDDVVVIDGNEYIGTIANLSGVTLGTEYTFYLNAFGYVAKFDEGTTAKNYGVVTNIYNSADGETTMVKMITADGSEKAYEVRDGEEDAFYRVYLGQDPTDSKEEWTGIKGSKGAIEKTVCTFKTTSSGIRMGDYLTAVGGAGQEYKASSNKLGSYSMSETSTAVLDLGSYESDGQVMVMTSFTEDIGYTAYAYDKSANDGTYRFIIVTDGTSNINKNTAIAVVEKAPMNTTVNDEDYQKVLVSREGETHVEVLFEDGMATGLKEGDVIVYVPGSDGVVTKEPTVIMSINSSYDSFRDSVIAKTNFEDGLGTVAKWEEEDSDVETYFGAVYKKVNNSIELLVKKGADGTSNITTKDLVDVTIDADTNILVYDYSYLSNKGMRVYSSESIGSVSDALYRPIVTDENKVIVDWNKAAEENVRPAFAYAKVVDGDVTDLVYILAN